MGGGKPIPAGMEKPDDYIVEFDGSHDPIHPFNWKLKKKLTTGINISIATFTAAFTSGIFAPGITDASREFGVGREVGVLGTTLFVLGFASGPLLWAPASELVGRRWPLTIGIFGESIFTIAAAVSKDIQTLTICRFFAGVFGASQVTVVPAVFSDMFDDTHRGVALMVYSLTVFVGPFAAPFIGGFIVDSSLSWRWVLYIASFMGFASTALYLLFVSETYPPAILSQKAATLRRQTHIWAIHAKQDEVEIDVRELIHNNFTRPLRMLVQEPILLFVSLYMSFIYGIVYALLEAYPYVFQHVYGMNQGQAGLTFFGLIIGLVCSVSFMVWQHRYYVRKLVANNHRGVPEWRLPPTVVGAPVFTVGLFWFGWTGFTPSIHWMSPTASGVLIGFGLLCIFQPCFNYLVDTYLTLVASTIAANMMLRSAIAAGFPLFSKQMFANLGIQWAGTLLGCLAAAMVPIPVLLTVYGPWIRGKSRMIRHGG
ncbi:putative bicyclomycin resistance protein [Aspergillus campestris IBT 28561]|uniref:Bicyclomycin resistance protein n=1 Tax=Aspergillus campestris (strain IBT 28561) TaxID=1392248 RepID=A0A2I1D3L1_ASPC2|nr:putative bicyclomycin resistance protein [Aspergillus campestris IBT 28561]PKY04459.1 putative bicyclomycin resistance protein [Aspergillus campestris IBT 28561]